MSYFETELIFSKTTSSEIVRYRALSGTLTTDILGVKVRIGNQPLVYNLKKLTITKNSDQIPGGLSDPGKDYYLIVHTIGASRTQGQAKVDELQYYAEAEDHVQTLDLIPGTKFKEVMRAGLNFEAALSVSGEALLTIPVELTESLLPQMINIGSSMALQLCSSISFAGKFTFSLQRPIVQSTGIGSNSCSWILNPNETTTPLLGDQLLVQSICVPKGTETLRYKLSGLVKADKGLFWKQQQKETSQYTVLVKLNP